MLYIISYVDDTGVGKYDLYRFSEHALNRHEQLTATTGIHHLRVSKEISLEELKIEAQGQVSP